MWCSGGCACGDSRYKGGSCNSYRSAIIKVILLEMVVVLAVVVVVVLVVGLVVVVVVVCYGGGGDCGGCDGRVLVMAL